MSKIFNVILIFILILGCDNTPVDDKGNYQLMRSIDGTVYRLNKDTGQVSVIQGDTIVPIKAKKNDIEEEKAAPNLKIEGSNDKETELGEKTATDFNNNVKINYSVENMRDWNEQQFQGKNLKVKFKSAWVEGILHYEFKAYPYDSLKKMLEKKEEDIYYQRKWHGFVIKLLDEEGVIVRVIPVKLWDMARTTDNQGKFESMFSKEKIELPEDEYIRITNYNLDWKLDRLLIPDYKFQNKIDDLMNTYSWYGEVDPKIDKDAPEGSKYWWMTFPDRRKVYFSNEQELLKSYQETIGSILENTD